MERAVHEHSIFSSQMDELRKKCDQNKSGYMQLGTTQGTKTTAVTFINTPQVLLGYCLGLISFL